MQPTTEILERISKDSLTHKEEVFTRLYRYLLRPDIYYQAYQRLYTNKGASTKGINQDTADGFSEAKIEKIIQSLADETYQPTPVRRTYIAKKSNPKKQSEEEASIRYSDLYGQIGSRSTPYDIGSNL